MSLRQSDNYKQNTKLCIDSVPGFLSSNSPVQDNMDKSYPILKKFLLNVDLKGSNHQRCKTVVEFIELSLKSEKDGEKDADLQEIIMGISFTLVNRMQALIIKDLFFTFISLKDCRLFQISKDKEF